MIGQTISHYHILDKLGEGGMGVVYLAEDTLLRRQVAIKSLTMPSTPGTVHFRARFLREARAASVLNHPHIATIHDYGETPDGLPYIVMELVKGENLCELLRRGCLSLERSIEITKEVAEALAEAHRHGLIHRDIKPSNIAINQRGEVKVLDFGLAKQLPQENVNPSDERMLNLSVTETREGVIIGTPSYFSPEQARGLPLDARSDLFSLGLLLYECVTGRHAFSLTSVMEICAQIIRDDPPPPSQINPCIPPELERITLKALAKKADDRYQTAEEMFKDLTAVQTLLAAGAGSRRIPFLGRLAARLRPPTTLTGMLKGRRIIIGALIVMLFALLLSMTRGSLWQRINRHEPSSIAQQWYQVGVEALREGSYFKASKLLEQAIRADDRFPLAHARLAQAWAELDYQDRATNEMLRVAELAPNSSNLSPVDALYIQAIAATTRHNYKGAVEFYEEIVRQLPENAKTYALYDLGRAYESAGETDHAVEVYEEVTRRDVRYAAASMRLGILYSRRQETQKAEAALSNAQMLYESQSNYDGLIEVFYQRGYLFNIQGKLPEAREQLQRALNLAAATTNRPQQIRTLLELSSVASSTGAMKQAQQYAHEGIELARSEQLENLTTSGLVDVGNTFFLKGELGEAEKYFTQALQVARANKGKRGEARASLSLASMYVQQGRGSEALSFLEPARAFYRQNNFRKETSQALLLIGYASEQQGHYEAGLSAFKEQLQLAEAMKDVPQTAQTQTAIGLLLTHQERYPEALDHFEESHRLSHASGVELNSGYDIVGRSNVLWQLGRYTEARDALAQASQVAGRIEGGNQHLLAWIHLSKALIALSELNHLEAVAESRRAAALASMQDRDLSVQATLTLGLAQARSGTTRAGLSSCQKALEIATQAGNPRLISIAQLALAEAMLETGDAQAAFETALKAKDSFARSGQYHSEWVSWFLAARASKLLRDEIKAREYASHAADLSSKLEATWGAEVYQDYIKRPDVQLFRKQIAGMLNESQ